MNRPYAPELLAVARDTLMNEVFPSVPEHLRYEVRMIASAMGIATREIKAGAAVEQQEISLFAELLPDSIPVGSTSLENARKAMAAAIRSGAFDAPGEDQQKLQSVLEKVVHNALTISNPKAARITQKSQ